MAIDQKQGGGDSGLLEADRGKEVGLALRDIETYFAPKTAKAARPEPARGSTRETLDHLVQRSEMMTRVLDGPTSLGEYLARQPRQAAIRSKMATEVRRHADVIHRLQAAGDASGPSLTDQPIEEQYRVLAVSGFVDPATVFPDMPEMPSLCAFDRLSRASKQQLISLSPQDMQSLMGQFTLAQQLLSNRWQRVTGRSLAAGEVPPVGEIVVRKSPVPLTPAWSSELAAREGRALAAEPRAAATPPATGPAHAAPPAPGAATPPASDAAVDADAAAAAALLAHRCDVDALLSRAGAVPLRPPAEGEPRYTFPGELLQREDIYYDYALVVPVEECGPYGDDSNTSSPRDPTAVRVIAAQAIAVCDFLIGLQLADAFGTLPGATAPQPRNVIEQIRQVLTDLIASVDATTGLFQIQDWKRRLSELAALVRAAGRRHLFTTGLLAGDDPRDFLDRLAAGIAAMPPFQTFQDDRIDYGQHPETNSGATYLEINGLRMGEVRYAHDNMCIDNIRQVVRLRPYLEYLGGPFPAILRELLDAAGEMRDAVRGFQGGAQEIQRKFEHLATGKINEAAFVLARLLDDAAEQLPLLTNVPAEGSKRLALLVVFRQSWVPEGYVKGKLVGHKNLLPSEKTTVRRRTFVRTTTEQTTAQEFARSRQEDFSQTSKETSEVLRESANKNNFSFSISGGFNILIGSLDVTQTTSVDLSSMSRATQSALAESAMKSAMSYSEKREVKIREETEVSEEQESQSQIENPNQAITANYFYYQLLRQYLVNVQLHDVRPVLLRTRYVPTETAIDDKFLADHAHALLPALPAQIADDLQQTVHGIDALARRRVRAQVDYDDRKLAFDIVRNAGPPATPEAARDRETRLAVLLEALDKAAQDLHAHDEAYLGARVRLDRALGYVRRNRCHCMQFIWHASPPTDDNMRLWRETFHGTPLPELTRGLQRQGYFGQEEIFDYVGPSYALTDALLRVLRPGTELSGLPRADLERTEVWQQLRQHYSDETLNDLLQQIENHAFVADPAGENAVLSSRRVQIAQDAVVVETLPGQVPLLEGYKLAHRMLDVERACLENEHLAARIADRPWQERGEDSYRVYRRDGQPAPTDEEGPVT